MDVSGAHFSSSSCQLLELLSLFLQRSQNRVGGCRIVTYDTTPEEVKEEEFHLDHGFIASYGEEGVVAEVVHDHGSGQ